MRGKIRKNRRNWYVDLHWNGERIRLFSDKEGYPLDSEARAERLLSHIQYEIDHGLFDPRNYIKRELRSLLFTNYAAAWLERQTVRAEQGLISRGYLQNLHYHVRSYLVPVLSSRNVRDLAEGLVEDFLSGLPRNLSAKTRQDVLKTLRKILSDAYRRRDISRVPEFPRVNVPEPHTKWLTEEEQARILREVKSPILRTFYLFLMHTGCRPGEARALKWNDVDFKQKVVVIRAAMDQETYRPSTKEGNVRIIPLTTELVSALRSLPRSIAGYVFVLKGKPLRKGLVSSVWRRAARKAGIEVSCYQGTRHSIASQLVNDGESLELIGKLLGHKCGASTRRYAHVAVRSLKEMMERKRE